MPKKREQKPYDFSLDNVSSLLGVVSLAGNENVKNLEEYVGMWLKYKSQEDIVHLFTEFIKLAQSVVNNNRQAIEGVLADVPHPQPQSDQDQDKKINLPTIFGALLGIRLASDVGQEKLCSTCAFRLGSWPNQSPNTTCQAELSVNAKDAPFFCHQGIADEDEPTKACVGYKQAVYNQKIYNAPQS